MATKPEGGKGAAKGRAAKGEGAKAAPAKPSVKSSPGTAQSKTKSPAERKVAALKAAANKPVKKTPASAAPKSKPRKPAAQRSRIPASGGRAAPGGRPTLADAKTPQEVLARIDELKADTDTVLAGMPGADELLDKVKAKVTEQAAMPDRVAVLGHALWLMTQMPTHKHLFIGDMEWMLIPPVSLGQFRLWRQGHVPVAMATWALVSPEIDQRLRQAAAGTAAAMPRLQPVEWKSGNNVWLMDILAPFGAQENAIKDLKAKAFPDRTLNALQPDPKKGGLKVVEW